MCATSPDAHLTHSLPFSALCRQPEGVSFTVAGETVRWQKWEFTLNFDLREGMIVRNVKYEGRPIFYRLSASEMTVPYGDPRSPVHRKSAYDFGECGAGELLPRAA